ncbi:MAG: SDR family oxidoreductase [Sphingobacteriales bacterium]|nr:MAG: SDR family oxidoreductase [Sphingobacteriales bacterium]
MERSKKYALITGASEGIGFELAKLFAADGYNLVIVARDQLRLDSAAEQLRKHQIDVVTLSKNLFDPEAFKQVYDEVTGLGLDVEVLVNNAGQGLFGKFADTDLERELEIIQLNVGSLVGLTKLFVRDFVARGSGKILNLASIASKSPGPYQSVYHGTKAFVHSFTAALRSELKDSGVTVTSLLPGVTDTGFFAKADMLNSKALDGEMADPATVAKDGYEALMNDKDMVVSGFKNKLIVAMGNVTPDGLQADMMGKMQEPKE